LCLALLEMLLDFQERIYIGKCNGKGAPLDERAQKTAAPSRGVLRVLRGSTVILRGRR
jgi:hypothetical protein